jgi:hypothetical protein
VIKIIFLKNSSKAYSTCQIDVSYMDAVIILTSKMAYRCTRFPILTTSGQKLSRKRWVDFVSTKRNFWKPTKDSSVSSAHFNPEDFVRMFRGMEGQGHLYSARLKTDYFGKSSHICPFENLSATFELSVAFRG